MPEDPNFGDIDDAQLEAAMAALLQASAGSRSALSSARSAQANGNGHLATQPIDPDPTAPVEPLSQWSPPPAYEPGPDLALSSDLAPDPALALRPDPDLAPDPALALRSDLEVSPWSPSAVDDLTAADLALVESSFGQPLQSAPTDFGALSTDGFSSPRPPEEPPLPPSSLPPPNFARPWKARGPRQFFTAEAWSTRKRELVPALVVACLLLLGLAAVVTTMTRDDGSSNDVKVSTPTSAVPTTITLDTVPPPPGPLPVDSVPPDTVAPVAGAGATGAKAAPKSRAPAPKSGSSPAPAPTAAQTPDPGSTPPNSDPVTTPTTAPPVTSPTTTPPPTTSPPTTQSPRDHCAAFISDPVAYQACLDRVGA